MIIRIFAPSVPTKPLNDAQMRGAFLYIYVHSQNTLMERLPHFMKHYMTEAIKYFLDIISPNNDMLNKMNRLFATFPEIDKAALGFPSGWENEPLWQ